MGSTTIICNTVTFVSASRLVADCDLAGVAAGVYQLTVVQGASSGTLAFGVTEATQAALAIREALARRGNGFQARFSLNVGHVVIGVIGTALRRSVALIGPSINLAARLLKQIPPGDIIATATVVERLRQETPELAQQFQLWNEQLELKGFHNELVTAFHVPWLKINPQETGKERGS